MKDDLEDRKDIAEQATYEDESAKAQQSSIKDPSLIAIIDKIEELIRALRKHIIRK